MAAQLDLPRGVALDGAGNLYIADFGNHRIRKVDSAGVISTVAAQLFFPSGVAPDGAGNLYIADSGNQRIRKVDSAGVISTVAGDGRGGYSGDGGTATAARLSNPAGVAVDGSGNLYIADTGNHRIRRLTPAPAPSISAGGVVLATGTPP